MKHILSLVCLVTIMLSHPVSAADVQKPLPSVKLAISNTLVKDFPIEITAATTEEIMKFTFGPKPDGEYCTLEAKILRQEDGSIKITATFSEEFKIIYGDGARSQRNVGFENLSIILKSGEEETLFSIDEKKFIIKLLKK